MGEHLSGEDLAALAEGCLSPERLCAVVLHLVQPCEPCLILLASRLEAPFPDEAELTAEATAAYDAAIDRAFAVALEHDRKLRRREIEQALAILDKEGHEALETPLKEIDSLARLEALHERSWSLRYENPSRMIELAQAAVRAAKTLDTRRYGIKRVMDLQCRAWAELGNAYRVTAQLDQAFDCFDHAIMLHDSGTQDTALRVRLLDLEASLAADRRQFGLACLILGYVYNHYLQAGDNHLAGRALVSQGLYRGYSGEYEEAVRLLREALNLIDEERDPSLVLSAVHNQLWFLVEAGHFDKARRYLFLNQGLLRQVGGEINELKLDWLEARIYQGKGHFDQAERGFRKVKAGLNAASKPHEAAVASLDLAMVLLSQKRTDEARPILREAVQIFNSLKVGREKMAAIFLLGHAAEMEQETARLLDVVSQVAAFLRRAEYDPNAKFNPVIR